MRNSQMRTPQFSPSEVAFPMTKSVLLACNIISIASQLRIMQERVFAISCRDKTLCVEIFQSFQSITLVDGVRDIENGLHT